MAKRPKRLPRKKSKKLFTKTAKRVHPPRIWALAPCAAESAPDGLLLAHQSLPVAKDDGGRKALHRIHPE